MCANDSMHKESMIRFAFWYITYHDHHNFRAVLHGQIKYCPVCSIECLLRWVFSDYYYVWKCGAAPFIWSISILMIVNMCASCYDHQIGNINHYTLFRNTSWNNGLHFMFYYVLTISPNPIAYKCAVPHFVFIYKATLKRMDFLIHVFDAISIGAYISPDYHPVLQHHCCFTLLDVIVIYLNQ